MWCLSAEASVCVESPDKKWTETLWFHQFVFSLLMLHVSRRGAPCRTARPVQTSSPSCLQWTSSSVIWAQPESTWRGSSSCSRWSFLMLSASWAALQTTRLQVGRFLLLRPPPPFTALNSGNLTTNPRLQLLRKRSVLLFSANNSELVERLEGVVSAWANQIKQVLTESEQMRKEADDVGPSAELEHWKRRMVTFNRWESVWRRSASFSVILISHPSTVFVFVSVWRRRWSGLTWNGLWEFCRSPSPELYAPGESWSDSTRVHH